MDTGHSVVIAGRDGWLVEEEKGIKDKMVMENILKNKLFKQSIISKSKGNEVLIFFIMLP